MKAAPGQFRTTVRTPESPYAHSASLGRDPAAGRRAIPCTRNNIVPGYPRSGTKPSEGLALAKAFRNLQRMKLEGKMEAAERKQMQKAEAEAKAYVIALKKAAKEEEKAAKKACTTGCAQGEEPEQVDACDDPYA